MISIRNTIFTACLFTSILSFAAPPDSGKIIFKSKEITLAQADNITRTNISFSPCSIRKNEKVYLYFNAWISGYSGWIHSLGLEINGKLLGDLTSARKVRLLNRIGKMQITAGKTDWWDSKKRGKALLLLFGAKDKVDKRIIYPREEGTGYLLDITDMVNLNKKNTLTFINYLTTKVYKDNKKRSVMIDDLQIGYMSNKIVAKLRGESLGKQYGIKLNILDQPPKIDAIINKQEWAKAYTMKLQNTRIGKLKNSTTVYIAYNNENLYFALQCFEKDMNKLKTMFYHTEEHDNSIWQDDCVDIILAPYGNKKEFYHIIINAAGITYDAFNGNTAWESSMRKAVRKGKNFWITEVAIPLRSLGVDLQAGDIWEINVGRAEKPSSELSAINLSPGKFSQNLTPVQFGSPKNGISLTAINFNKSNKIKINNK